MSYYELARLRKHVEELEKENDQLRIMNRRLRVFLIKSKKGITRDYLDRIEAALRARTNQ